MALAETIPDERRNVAESKYPDYLTVAAYVAAWRVDPLLFTLSPAMLAATLPQFIRSGGVGLIWPRLCDRAEDYGAVAPALEFAYQSQIEHNRSIEQGIVSAITCLRAVRIDPVVLKGWAVARLYPPPVVRLCGDIDIWVSLSDFLKAKAALADAKISGVDLHKDAHWGDPECTDLLARSQLVPLNGIQVRVPGWEDHLRLLCLHFLRHGALRPLWLCDVGLMVESIPADFDGEYCLGRDPVRREWILTVIALAHVLLDARIAGTPAESRVAELPGWLMPAVLHQWEFGQGPPGLVMPEILANPRAIYSTFRRRFPEPITATVRCHAHFSEFPRLPIQWAAYLKQIAMYSVMRLPNQMIGVVRQRRERVAGEDRAERGAERRPRPGMNSRAE